MTGKSGGRKGQENAFECIDLAAMAIQLALALLAEDFLEIRSASSYDQSSDLA